MLTQTIANWIMKPLLRLQTWDVEYFEHMIAEWQVLQVPANDVDYARITTLIERFHKDNHDGLSRSCLLEFEQTLLSRKSGDALIHLAPTLRLRYRDIVGPRQYAAYKEASLPESGTMDDAARLSLLDDLSALIDTIHWRYVLAPFRNKERVALTISALVWVLLYTVLWLAVVAATARRYEVPFITVFATVLYCGILGGFISALRRMQSINDDTDSAFVIQNIADSDFWLWFSPLLGAVFAVVAYLFFLSGLLSGSLFPAFHEVDPLARGPWPFWMQLLPQNPDSYGKLFLWSFIAGFAERFIPDMIDSIIRRADRQQNSVPVVTPPVVISSARTDGNGHPHPGRNATKQTDTHLATQGKGQNDKAREEVTV